MFTQADLAEDLHINFFACFHAHVPAPRGLSLEWAKARRQNRGCVTVLLPRFGFFSTTSADDENAVRIRARFTKTASSWCNSKKIVFRVERNNSTGHSSKKNTTHKEGNTETPVGVTTADKRSSWLDKITLLMRVRYERQLSARISNRK